VLVDVHAAEGLQGLVARLEAEPHSACLLGRGGVILFVNAAWDRFAVENGGAPGCLGERIIGKTYFNFIDGAAPRAFFEGAWLRVLAGRPVTLRSECSTGTVSRELSTRLLPITVGRDPGAAVIHEVERIVPVEAPRECADPARWVGVGGCVEGCTACRRLRRADGSGWDLVPALIEKPPPAHWGFCPICASAYRSAREPRGAA
jgi:hypothetical protein